MSQTIIDDQDLTHVKYNGTWLRGGSSHEHDETVASSTQVNDSFTVSFTGNSITVYGTIDITSGGVLTNYSIDGAPPSQTTSQAGSGDTYNQQFWRSPTLNEGDHKLVVTMVKVNPNAQAGEGTIWFDYFSVLDPRIQNSTIKSKNIGAIVGGVIGGVFAVIFIILAVLFLRRRGKRRLDHIQPWSDKESELGVMSSSKDIREVVSINPNIEPFPLGIEENNANSTTSRKVTSPSSATRTISHPRSLSTASSSTSPSSITNPPNNVVTLNPPSRKRQGGSIPTPPGITVLPSSSSPPEPAIQHVDSGVRVANTDPTQTPSVGLELPPVYSAV
ncbi:hypothetical protein BYT27DRAFT_7227583 [Phlegmacium glaucopus]|nr:hypothetical protein BYT27DRAFT_7227583 [Phlegmacium glaucopus]